MVSAGQSKDSGSDGQPNLLKAFLILSAGALTLASLMVWFSFNVTKDPKMIKAFRLILKNRNLSNMSFKNLSGLIGGLNLLHQRTGQVLISFLSIFTMYFASLNKPETERSTLMESEIARHVMNILINTFLKTGLEVVLFNSARFLLKGLAKSSWIIREMHFGDLMLESRQLYGFVGAVFLNGIARQDFMIALYDYIKTYKLSEAIGFSAPKHKPQSP